MVTKNDVLEVKTNAPQIIKKGPKPLMFIAKNWAAVFLISLIIVFSFTGKNFFHLTNFQNIIHLATIFLLLAAAETFVIITGGIDLSVGFIMGLSSVLSALVMQKMNAFLLPQPVSIAVGAIVAILVCLIPGFINGLLITKYNVPPFIATLGMWGIANGITLKLCNGFPVSGLPNQLVEIGNGFIIYYHKIRGLSFFSKPEGLLDSEIKEMIRIIPNSFIFISVVLFVLWFLLKKTRFGHYTYAIGGSMEASVRSGINTKKHLMKVYILASLLAGLAGVFNVFQTGIGNFTPFSAMYELFAIAAVVIGGASLMGGKGRIVGSVIGIFMLGVLENGLALSGVEPFFRFIAVGLILIIAVIIDQLFPELF